MDTQRTIGTVAFPMIEGRSRQLNRCSVAIDAAVRRIVHDYVDGWGIVQTQTTTELRRKKRQKNRRASERQTFNRPVWVHKALWAWDSTTSRPALKVLHDDVLVDGGMYLVHDLSNAGMGLVSDRAPTSRLVVLEFDSWCGRPIEIALFLRWRRRVSPLEFRSGGSILGVLTPES